MRANGWAIWSSGPDDVYVIVSREATTDPPAYVLHTRPDCTCHRAREHHGDDDGHALGQRPW